MIAQDRSSNRLVTFLENNHGPCEKLVCATCGGILHYLSKLRNALSNQDELIEGLKNLTSRDVVRIANDRTGIRCIVTNLPEEARQVVLECWRQNARNDPDLALAILRWTQYGQRIPINVHEILIAAETLLLNLRDVRNDLREALDAECELPPRLRSA